MLDLCFKIHFSETKIIPPLLFRLPLQSSYFFVKILLNICRNDNQMGHHFSFKLLHLLEYYSCYMLSTIVLIEEHILRWSQSVYCFPVETGLWRVLSSYNSSYNFSYNSGDAWLSIGYIMVRLSFESCTRCSFLLLKTQFISRWVILLRIGIATRWEMYTLWETGKLWRDMNREVNINLVGHNWRYVFYIYGQTVFTLCVRRLVHLLIII